MKKNKFDRNVILYRSKEFEDQELEAAKNHFDLVTNSRMDIRANDLVINRYSSLPFFEEQERDIRRVGAQLINDCRSHHYVADIRNWYADLKELTFKTYSISDIPTLPEGSYILKGQTNSKKFLFSSHMFAQTKADISRVLNNLLDDSLISTQDIYIREFVPLHTYFISLHGLPITKEFRFFICDGINISGGYYWSSHAEDVKELNDGKLPSIYEVPDYLLMDVINKVGDKIRFYVVDVAQTQDGEWKVVELNDGGMSSLSENSPEMLYSNLAKALI